MTKRNIATIDLNSILVEGSKITDSEKIQLISIVESYPEEINTFVNRNAYSKYVCESFDIYNKLIDAFKERNKYISLKIEKLKSVIVVTIDINSLYKDRYTQVGCIVKMFGNINSVKIELDQVPPISDKAKQTFINQITVSGDIDGVLPKFITSHTKKHIPYLIHFINESIVVDRLITKEPTLTSMMVVSYCHDRLIKNIIDNTIHELVIDGVTKVH